MSWDVSLTIAGVAWAGKDWNYTYNTTPMILEAMTRAGIDGKRWGDLIDGASGPVGRRFLEQIVEQWDASPDDFQAMNPPNGWGSFTGEHGIRQVFGDMIAAASDIPDNVPTVWTYT